MPTTQPAAVVSTVLLSLARRDAEQGVYRASLPSLLAPYSGYDPRSSR